MHCSQSRNITTKLDILDALVDIKWFCVGRNADKTVAQIEKFDSIEMIIIPCKDIMPLQTWII